MFFFQQPLTYDEPVFRPPSEAHSLILQVTLGCSWNKCAFCDMYGSKQFHVEAETKIFNQIQKAAEFYRRMGQDVRKVFLADGNAMVLSHDRLQRILEKLNETFPHLGRVAAYALPGDIIAKTPEQLKTLCRLGLKLLYIGIESGDDELLKAINKCETADSTIRGLLKAQDAGLKCSVMIITGLGGGNYSHQHAVRSAEVLNRIQPAYASTLVLGTPFGIDDYERNFNGGKGGYIPMSLQELMKEQYTFISHTQLQRTVFRSDHISNFLALRGTLGRDKEALMATIDAALARIAHRPPIPYEAMAF